MWRDCNPFFGSHMGAFTRPLSWVFYRFQRLKMVILQHMVMKTSSPFMLQKKYIILFVVSVEEENESHSLREEAAL